MEEILELQLLIRGRAFAAFSTIEKPLAGHKKNLSGPYVVQAWFSAMVLHLFVLIAHFRLRLNLHFPQLS